MRTREEIIKDSKGFFSENQTAMQLEVLLDIRELLEELVRLESLRGRIDTMGGSGALGREPPLSAPPAK